MTSYRILFTFSLAVLLCMPAMAQQARPAAEMSAQPTKTIKISPDDVRMLTSDDIPEVFGTSTSKAIVLDTLNYNSEEAFDTLFFVAITNLTGAATSYEGVGEFTQRFTPGEGTGRFFGVGAPGALPASDGQEMTLGFCLGGPDPVQGDATDQLVFFVQKTEAADGFIVRPNNPFIAAALDLGPLMDPDPALEGVCYELDLTGLNVFFEADEEIFKGFFLAEDPDGTPDNAEVQFLIDDGDPSDVDPNYDPVRSILFSDPPFVPATGFYSWFGSSNYLWYNTVDYKAVPLADGEITAACGDLPDCLDFMAGDTFTYTGCITNNSGSARRFDATVVAYLPTGGTFTLLSLTTPTIPSGPTVCRTFSAGLPGVAPDGLYAVQLLVDDDAAVDFTYDTDRVFFTKSTPTGAAPVASSLSRADMMNVEAKVSSEWFATPVTDWAINGESLEAYAEAEATVIGAYPNPFARETTIRFATNEATEASLVIYDVTGREVAVLVSGTVEAGTHDVVFDARGLASGLYVYRLEAGETTQTGRITLLK